MSKEEVQKLLTDLKTLYQSALTKPEREAVREILREKAEG